MFISHADGSGERALLKPGTLDYDPVWSPKGQWIVGWGWDEGAWANRYPDMTRLSARVPDHPVLLRGLHSFAARRQALQSAESSELTAALQKLQARFVA